MRYFYTDLLPLQAFGESQILDAFAQLPPEATPDDSKWLSSSAFIPLWNGVLDEI